MGRAPATAMLSLSVLIPTKNRPADLLTCLRSVVTQEPRPDEIVVVDQSANASVSDVTGVVEPHGIRLRYAHAPDLLGLTHARNRAVDLSSGDVVLFLDDDVELAPGYIREIMRVFEADPKGRVGGAGGLIVNLPDSLSRVQWIRSGLFYRGPFSVERDTLAFHLHPGTRPRRAMRLHGCDLALRRDVFRHVRFDEGYSGYSFGEDRDFSVRVSRRFELWWVPAARLIHKQTPASRLRRAQFSELRVLSWLRFYRQCVDKTPYNLLCYLWLNVGFVVLLLNFWDWPTVAGTWNGFRRLAAIVLRREQLGRALGNGWHAPPRS